MYGNFFKPALDRLVALIVLICASPLLLIGILLAAVDARGNPFFVHPRPGYKGKKISIIKLKTMRPEHDADGNKRTNIERISTIGNWLRKSSIDELPQLFNVLLGGLSLVGPRPLEMRYLSHYTAEQNRRHDVLPGITGLAQVSGRNKLNWEEKFALDVRYVESRSFKLDFEILIATACRLFKFDDVNSESSKTMDPFA